MAQYEEDFEDVLIMNEQDDEDTQIREPMKPNKVDYYKILKTKKAIRHNKNKKNKRTIMPVGKYAGINVEKLPLSYCRWIVSQKFDEHILKAAKKKIENSIYSDHKINISRHAIDMFSIRFIELWINHINTLKEKIGIATFVANMAQEALNDGIDISKNRYEGDGIIKKYKDIKFVFHGNDLFPEYRELVTVM